MKFHPTAISSLYFSFSFLVLSQETISRILETLSFSFFALDVPLPISFPTIHFLFCVLDFRGILDVLKREFSTCVKMARASRYEKGRVPNLDNLNCDHLIHRHDISFKMQISVCNV